MQEYVEEAYSLFMSHVAEGRKMEWSEVDAIGQGRVWTGDNALKIGLIDQLGGLEDAVRLAAEMADIENYRIVKLPELSDPLTELLKGQTIDIRTWFLKKELGENWKYFEQVQKLQRMKGLYARVPYELDIN
jgi:protease-4